MRETCHDTQESVALLIPTEAGPVKSDEEQIAKEFDALIAQLPRDKNRRQLRALPWLIGMTLALIVMLVIAQHRQNTSENHQAVPFPLAVCGNGLLEPSEDCELNEPDCPSDCVRRAQSSDSTTPKQREETKE